MPAYTTRKRNGIGEPTRNDIAAMADIFREGQIYHNQLFPDIFCSPDDEAAIHVYLGGFLKPRNPFRTRHRFALGWFVEGVVAGYVLFDHYSRSDVFFGKDRSFAHIDDIAVAQDFRQQGIASKLMTAVLAKVEAKGGGLVSGQVWSGNDASEKLFINNNFSRSSGHFHHLIDGSGRA